MADRRILLLNNVNAGATVNLDGSPILNGKKLIMIKAGGADINMGDNKSSAYLVQWGIVGNFEEIIVFALTGNTVEIIINREFIGDGIKFMRITRQNNSSTTKRLPFWLHAYDE